MCSRDWFIHMAQCDYHGSADVEVKVTSPPRISWRRLCGVSQDIVNEQSDHASCISILPLHFDQILLGSI